MGHVRPTMPVIYFCALLRAPSVPLADVEARLTPYFGPIILQSPDLPFVQTTYYEREMGAGLTRTYLGFAPLRSMGDLAAAKHMTNQLEARWAVDEQRIINIDPGYLDLAKVVLVTTKDYSHRLYIGGGMYAEVTLQYRSKSYQPWEWTYPDYQQPAALDFFNQFREVYKGQLRRAHATP